MPFFETQRRKGAKKKNLCAFAPLRFKIRNKGKQNMRIKIKDLKQRNPHFSLKVGSVVTVKGWVRTVRNQKTFSFIEINDGSTLSNFQVVANPDLPHYDTLTEDLSTGVSVAITGIL